MDEVEFDEIMRIQRTMASRVFEEQQTDNKIKLMGIINELTGSKNKNLQKEGIIIESINQGLTEVQVENILIDLERDRFVVQKAGYVRKV